MPHACLCLWERDRERESGEEERERERRVMFVPHPQFARPSDMGRVGLKAGGADQPPERERERQTYEGGGATALVQFAGLCPEAS